jgi:flagellar protein FlgJ
VDSFNALPPAAATAAANYTDIAGLNSIRQLGGKDQRAALEQIGKQFESFFISQVFKSMRAANAVFAEDNPLNSNEMQFRQEMLDQQLSLSLTQGKGLGLAEVLVRQLGEQYGVPDRPSDGEQAPNTVTEGAPKVGLLESWISRMPSAVQSAVDAIEPVIDSVRETVSEFAMDFSSKDSFVRSLLPHAEAAAEKLGVDPKVLVAQAALETGWGQHVIEGSNNLFNIKARGWAGKSVAVNTLEYRDGLPIQEKARFRAYESIAESFHDFVDFLTAKPRYQQALASASDAPQFVRELQAAGYATDPEYANKILRVMNDDAIQSAG